MKFLIFGLVAILFSAPITGMVPNVDAISTFNINMSCVGETLTVVISDENGDPVNRAKVQTFRSLSGHQEYEKTFFADKNGMVTISKSDNIGGFGVSKSGFSEHKVSDSICVKPVQEISKKYLEGVFDGCKDGLWVAHFVDEKTKERILFGSAMLYDENLIKSKTISLYPDGSLKLFPDGTDNYPPVENVIFRSGGYEDLWFQPVCPELPNWIKTNAGWWAEDLLDDETFVKGIEFLISANIIHIPETEIKIQENNDGIPAWVKNNAKWWADGTIDDNSFIQSIQFLVKEGIIAIETPITEEVTISDFDVKDLEPSTYDESFEINIIGCDYTSGGFIDVSWGIKNNLDDDYTLDLQILGADGNGNVLEATRDIVETKSGRTIYDDRLIEYKEGIQQCFIEIVDSWITE